jgi:hypothetical protein
MMVRDTSIPILNKSVLGVWLLYSLLKRIKIHSTNELLINAAEMEHH